MYLIVTKDYASYEDYLKSNFKYLEDKDDIANIDPASVVSIMLIGDFRDHPIYFSDEFLQLQCDVAACNSKKRKWWQIW